MKKICAFILILTLIFALCSCDGIYEEVTLTNTSEYYRFIENEEFFECRSELLMFPKSIENSKIIDFYCNWQAFSLIGCGFEVLLDVQYDENSFNKEISRIKKIECETKVQYDTNNFNKPAYVSMLGYHFSNEYALIDKDLYRITYIYTQLHSEEDFKKISSSLLPKTYYDYGSVENYSFSIYDKSVEPDIQYGYDDLEIEHKGDMD